MHIEVSAVTDAIPRLAHSERDKLEWIKTASVIVICLLAVASSTAVLREAWATLPESSSRPLLATLAQSRNLAQALLETTVCCQFAMLQSYALLV